MPFPLTHTEYCHVFFLEFAGLQFLSVFLLVSLNSFYFMIICSSLETFSFGHLFSCIIHLVLNLYEVFFYWVYKSLS